MGIIADRSPSVYSEVVADLDLDRIVSDDDRDWFARQSDSWHDQFAEKECGEGD